MAQWWSNYDEINCEQRVRVTRAVAQLSTEEVKRLKQYMVTRRLANAKIAEFLAQGGVGASTSNAPLVPIPEAVPNLEENDPIYRALAFPVDAPRGGPSRPFVFPMRGTSPRTERVAVGEPMQQQWQSRGLLWICRTKRWTDLPLDPADNMMRPI